MFRQFIAAVLISTQAIGPAAAYSLADGQFYFRYKNGISSSPANPDDGTSKDIDAFYIAGIGEDFSEQLPMKPAWENDAWSISSGSLPEGISFNSSTRTFEGSPTQVTSGRVVELVGRDVNNNEVATASVTFDVYELPDHVVNVDFYAHEGKFSSNALQLPSGVEVFGDPTLLSPTPPGVTYNARYFEGIPTQARLAPYPVLAIGYDFTGKAVVAFKGKYLVEKGPTFAGVKDDLRNISYQYGYARWYNQAVPKIKRSIGDPSKVRYFIETENNEPLPGSLSYSNDPLDRRLNGYVRDYYSQVNVRYRAVDTDGVPGYSDWFKLGSLGNEAVCQPRRGDSIALTGVANTVFAGYRIPSNSDSSEKLYTVSAGTLPEGILLNSATGKFEGTPKKQESQKGIEVQITFPGNSNAEAVTCGPYNFTISAEAFDLKLSSYPKQLRVGSPFEATLKPSGGILEPYTLVIDADTNQLPANFVFDPETGKVSGTVDAAGSYSATFRLTNGDGVQKLKTISFSGHNPLKIDDVASAPTITQYDTTDDLVSVTYDADTVIGEAVLTVEGGSLPAGLKFNGDSVVSGGTRLPPLAGGYGPYQFRLTDATNESVKTNEFRVIVEQRTELPSEATVQPQYHVNRTESVRPFSVTQAPLAKDFLPLKYEISPALPVDFKFNEATGVLTGSPKVKGEYPGYTIKVSETSSDNLSATSEVFTIAVDDPPAIPDRLLAKLEGNVGGPMITTAPPLTALQPIADYLVGGPLSVSYTSSAPEVPGLTLSSTGQISGKPEVEFSGDIAITYQDQGGRDGKLIVPTAIYPYPAVRAPSPVVELPRLTNASEFGVIGEASNSGFYKGITWSVDPSGDALPDGLVMSQANNKLYLSKSTKLDIGTSRNVVFNAKSIANGIDVKLPVSFTVVEPRPFVMNMPSDLMVTWLQDGLTGAVVSKTAFDIKSMLSGSYVEPVSYAISGGPSWLTINKDTGQLSGVPTSVGDWDIILTVKDAEDRVSVPASLNDAKAAANNVNAPAANGAATFKLRVSPSGKIEMTPGGQSFAVRDEETFQTDPQIISNAVSPLSFKHNAPDTVVFDEATKTFKGKVDASKNWGLTVTDAHDRTATIQMAVAATDPLVKPGVKQNLLARNFLASDPIDVTFTPVTKVMGEISYGISGELPGTLYYKTLREDGLYAYQHFNNVGGVSTTVQNQGETVEQTEERLAGDRLIFDTEALTLRGIASAKGSFPVSLVAYDDHEAKGYKVDPADATRTEFNTASVDFTINVEDRLPLLQDQPTMVRDGRQYDPGQKIAIELPEADNVLGEVEYTFTGLPGAVYYRTFVNGLSAYHTSQFGPVVEAQLPGETRAQAELRLPADAMIFDVASRTLEGIASVAGAFEIVVHAKDVHDISGLKNSPLNAVDTQPVTVTVTPAAALEIANVLGSDRNATAETIHQFTSTAAITTQVSNAAYGRPVTWTKVSGNLPAGVTGTSGSERLSYAGYATTKGTFSGITWKAVDAVGREITSSPITLSVTDRQALEIVSSKANPRTMIVFETEAETRVSGKNTAYGKGIAKADWSISGVDNLPPGVTHVIEDGGVRFIGKSDVIGTYRNIIVTGRDSLGASASINLTFNVVQDPEAIILNVSNIKTKPGFPVAMEPPFAADLLSTDNTYGALRFYSNNLSGIPQLSLDGATGAVSGEFTEQKQVQFDIFVADETNRVTSKPVVVDVIPNLRLLVPAQVAAEQGKPVSALIATDYVLGTVTYEKGAGDWPVGFVVDPQTGNITSSYTNPATGVVSTSVVAQSGTYPGLTIVGKDAFGTYVDQRSSNTFAIVVTPTTAEPDIANQAKTILGTEGQPIVSWWPKASSGWASGVVTKGNASNAWNIAGTVYTSNYDLSQYGLSLNRSTGEISGTPTAPFIIRDFVITVTSERGDSDSTTGFWIGVAPEEPITVVASQKNAYYFRMNEHFATDPIAIVDALGNYKYSQPRYVSPVNGSSGTGSTPINADTGVWGDMVATRTSWINTPYNYTTTITDEFNRTGSFTWYADWRAALVPKVTASSISFEKVYTVSAPVVKPTVTGVGGTATWNVEGLPTGLTFDGATGAIYGSVKSGTVSEGAISVTVKVKDSWDGREESVTATITLSNAVPDIADQAKTNLGKQGSAITSWLPKAASGWAGPVIEKDKKTVAWNMPGTVFSASHDLAQYGLSFDQTTGQISGTPTAPFIVRDFAITVTAPSGVSDSTAPFWLGVAPSEALAIDPEQRVTYDPRLYKDFRSDDLVVLNYVGDLTFVKASSTRVDFDTATGAFYKLGDQQLADYPSSTYNNYTARVTDEFGRTVNFMIKVKFIKDLAVTAPASSLYLNRAYTTATPLVKPAVANAVGTVTWSVEGLPSGLTYDASTGAVIGKASSDTVAAGTYTVTFKGTDSADGALGVGTATITVLPASKYWRFDVTAMKVHATGDFLCLSELRWLSGNVDVSLGGTLTADSYYDATKKVGLLVDGNYGGSGDFAPVFCTGGQNGSPENGKKRWIELRLNEPTTIDSLAIYARRDGSAATHPTAWNVLKSDDGVNWSTAWTGANAAMNSGSSYVSKP